MAIAFAAIGGTSFRNGDLTDANFRQATLKSVDFRDASLIRTCWQNVKGLTDAEISTLKALGAVEDGEM
jgi:uncharacterized protein YjbI with pentapeptide repeats